MPAFNHVTYILLCDSIFNATSHTIIKLNCHAKVGPGVEKWSGRTSFGCQNWSDPGPLFGCQKLMVQLVAKSGPGVSTYRKPFLAFRSLCRTHFYKVIYACMANMSEHTCALLIIHADSSDMVKILKETHATASTRHISRVLPHADQKI